MACPSSGAISIQSLVDEFGGNTPHSISEYYRNAGEVPGNNTSVPTSGAISLQNFYAAVNEIQHVHSSNTTHQNYASVFGSNWSTAVPKRVTINSGVTIGGTTTHAINIPSGMGGTLVIDNNGHIQGYGGSANSGSGGHAIYCAQSSGVTINNASGATIKAGGGGGGAGGSGGSGGTGGSGGSGGTGGGGWYWSGHYGYADYHGGGYRNGPCGAFNYSWGGYLGGYQGGYPNDSCTTSNAWGICANSKGWGCSYVNGYTPACFTTASKDDSDGGTNFGSWNCVRRLFQNSGGSGGGGGNGGSGGSGGSGGNGGRGEGYGQSSASGSGGNNGSGGSGGSNGSGGSGGSNNAGSGGTGGQGGTGGTGGQGGTGGTGGTFGNAGATGNTGAQGSTGNTRST